MKSSYYLDQYQSNGFTILKNFFSNNEIKKILFELKKVKKILPRIKKKDIS